MMHDPDSSARGAGIPPGKERELAQWNERFAPAQYWFGTEPTPFLASQAHRLRPGMKALAIADGEGRNGVWLARQGLDVTTVDIAEKGIAKAQRLAAQSGVKITTILADIESWDWGTPRFDLVVGILFQFLKPPARTAVFRQMQDVLKLGGLVMIQGYRPEQIAYGTGGPPFVENLYTAEMLRAEFAAMEILELNEYDREQPEGMQHRGGMCALIDLVARKRS
jgi:SAM-dependent methyltransferase